MLVIEELANIFDEPFSDASAIPTMLLSKVVSNEVSVALSADAGDEIFCGYPKYQRASHLFSRFTLTPNFLKKLCLIRGNKYSAGLFYNQKTLYRLLVNYEKITDYLPATNPANLMGIMSRSSSRREISNLLLSGYTHSNSFFDDFSSIPEIKDCLDKMLAIDYKTYLVDDVMVKVDRSTMSASLEGREPFLDHRIIEFVAQLPSSLKLKGENTKHLLKEIVYRYVPREIMERPKRGFGIPLIYWLNNELESYVCKYLDRERIKQEGLLNPDAVAAIRNAYMNGNLSLWIIVWKIITFEMWFEKWMK
jgi:asparagine synthase (glutamine-hydrolysing)